MSYEALTPTGRVYQSSDDCVDLVFQLLQHRIRLLKEIIKRHSVVAVPVRIHQLSESIVRIRKRHLSGDHRHYESEEGWIREFGEWLIQKFAEVSGTPCGKWEFAVKGPDGEPTGEVIPFDPVTHLRKRIKIQV